MTTDLRTQPIQHIERSTILDALRGFALLGICIANFPVFSLYIFQSPQTKAALPTANVDNALLFFETAFVEGKFYSLFSLLFGLGFTIILHNSSRRGANGIGIFYRRLLFLILIGLAHSFLLWDGDILLLYGLLGLLLPLFWRCSDKTLLVAAALLVLSPLLFDAVKVWTQGRWDLSAPLLTKALEHGAANGITLENASNWVVVHDRYADVLLWSEDGFFWRWQMLIGTNRLPKVFAMFLLGLWAGRRMLYVQLAAQASLLKTVQKWTGLVGLPASIAFAYFSHDSKTLPASGGLWDTLFYAVSVVPLCLFYTVSFCRLWLHSRWQRRLQWLAPAGQMALTNYISQSLIGVFIFYGVGLGLGGQVGPAIFIPMAFTVVVLQRYLSRWWLRRYNYGPLEWLWRQATYWKKLPLRKAATIAPVA